MPETNIERLERSLSKSRIEAERSRIQIRECEAARDRLTPIISGVWRRGTTLLTIEDRTVDAFESMLDYLSAQRVRALRAIQLIATLEQLQELHKRTMDEMAVE